MRVKNICIFISNYGSHQKQYLHKILKCINEYKNYNSSVFLFSTTEDNLLNNYNNIKIQNFIYPENINLNLAFQHKLFLKNNFETLKTKFDIFIGLENDILLKENTIEYFEKYQEKIDSKKYAIGTLRYEIKNNERYYTDTGGKSFEELFEPILLIDNKPFFITKHNPHSGMFIFTKDQIQDLLDRNINLTPHNDLESSITNFYNKPWPGSNDGIQKIISLHDIDEISVHHLPNKYVNDQTWMAKYNPKTAKELKIC